MQSYYYLMITTLLWCSPHGVVSQFGTEENGVPPPKVSVRPFNQTVTEGQEVTIVCLAEGSPRPSVTWEFGANNEPITPMTEGIILRQRDSEHTLTLKNVLKSDSGSYRCIASNTGGKQYKVAYVSVKVPFTSSTKAKRIEELVNVKLQLSLKAESQSSIGLRWKQSLGQASFIKGYHIYWTKTDSTAYERITLDNSLTSYILGNLQPDTEYEVSVEAYNDRYLSPISKSERIRTLPEAPTIASTLTERISSLQNVKLQLSLRAKSQSSILLRWKLVRPASPIKGYHIYLRKSGGTDYKRITLDNSRTSYILENLQPDTEYEVSMEAYNDRYLSSTSKRVTARTLSEVHTTTSTLTKGIHNLQNVKLQLSLRAKSKSSILLSWKPVRPTSLIKGYKIYWTKRGSIAYESVTLDNSRTSYMLRNLQADTEYEARIKAFNNLYVSPTSTGETARTLSEAPTTASTLTEGISSLRDVKLQLSLQAKSQSSILLRWEPIRSSIRIKGYHIYLRKSGSTDYQRATLDNSRTSYMLGNLQPDTEYEVSIEAFNDRYLSPISKRETIRTLPKVPITASTPTKKTYNLQNVKLQLALQAKSKSSILIRWKPVHPSIRIKGFFITLRKSGGTDYKRITLDNSRTSYILENLQPDTEYEVSMETYNDRYISPTSKLEKIRTLSEVPITTSRLSKGTSSLQNVKLQLSLQAKGQSSILLRWKPVRPASRIKGYHIYWTKRGSTAYQRVTLDSSRTSYMLGNLQRDTEYEVSMEAFNDLYLSPTSKSETGRTLSAGGWVQP